MFILWKREYESMHHMVMTVSPPQPRTKYLKIQKKNWEHQKQQKIGISEWQGVSKGELASLRVISTI